MSNESLGGLVAPHIADVDWAKIETGTWPTRRKRRPPPLKICHDDEQLLVPAPQRSAVWQNSKRPWTPRTPTRSGSDEFRHFLVEDASDTCSPLPLSRFHSARLSGISTPAATPTKVQLPSVHTSVRPPVELPGSLLLPSQGFPPPPVTPRRPVNLNRQDTAEPDLSSARVKLTRQDTAESDFSSAPSLTTSTSSCPSEMDILRGWKSASAASGPMAALGQVPVVSKPFSAMSLEELLENLPNSNAFTISQMWLPAIREKCGTLKVLLQDAENRSLKSNAGLKTMGEDLKEYAEQARIISNTYSKALKSAESLLERDTINLQERLHISEMQLKEERARVVSANKTVKEKEGKINQLDHTLKDAVRTLGTFVQNNVSHWVDSFHDPDTQAAMTVIKDYSDIISDNSVRYVRITEAAHHKTASSLRDAQANAQKYRIIAQSQVNIIEDQSEQLDRHVQKCDECLQKVQGKSHEILLLDQKRGELEAKVTEYEAALVLSQSAIADRDRLEQRNHELELQLEAQAKEVENKDQRLVDLRSQLGSAREEVLARRGDVRNIIVQTQAMLGAHSETSDGSNQASSSKTRKVLGLGKDKAKQTHPQLPLSRSSLTLGFRPLNADLMSSPPDPRYSSKEAVIGSNKLKNMRPSTASTTSSGYSEESARGSCPVDPFSDIRPRSDSLGALETTGTRQFARCLRVDTHKELPSPPPTMVAFPPDRPPPATPHQDSPMPKRNYREPHEYPSQTPQLPARRILSDIPEASVEDADSPYAPSATSSDREVYRRSICALNALAGFDGSLTTEERVSVEAARENAHQADDQSSEGSEVLTVSQMYHQGGRVHIRS